MVTQTSKITSPSTKKPHNKAISKVKSQVAPNKFPALSCREALLVNFWKKLAYKATLTIAQDYLGDSLCFSREHVCRTLKKMVLSEEIVRTENKWAKKHNTFKTISYRLTPSGSKLARKLYQASNPFKGYRRDPKTGKSFTFKAGQYPAASVQEARLAMDVTEKASTKDHYKEQCVISNKTKLNAREDKDSDIKDIAEVLVQHRVTNSNSAVNKTILREIGWYRHLSYHGLNSIFRFPLSLLKGELQKLPLRTDFSCVYTALSKACYAAGIRPDHEWSKAHVGKSKSCYIPEHEVCFEIKKKNYLKKKSLLASEKKLMQYRAKAAASKKIGEANAFGKHSNKEVAALAKRTALAKETIGMHAVKTIAETKARAVEFEKSHIYSRVPDTASATLERLFGITIH